MKRPVILSFFFLVVFSFTKLRAQKIPDRQKVLKDMLLANENFMIKNPNVGKTVADDKERPGNIWTRDVYYEGLMALHQIYPQNGFYDYAVDWAEFHNWGLRNKNITRNADGQICR